MSKLSLFVGNTKLALAKHSPLIFGISACVGLVATVVLASKETLKAKEIVESAKKDIQTIDDAVEIAKTSEEVIYDEKEADAERRTVYIQTGVKLLKNYAPSILTGVATMLLGFGSYKILTGRISSITAYASGVSGMFADYRKRVKDIYGEEVDKQLYAGTHKESFKTKVEDEEVEIIDGNVVDNEYSQYAVTFDRRSKLWTDIPHFNMITLKKAEERANEILEKYGHIMLNTVFDILHMPHTSAGAVVGWLSKDNGGKDGVVRFGLYDVWKKSAWEFANEYTNEIILDFNVDGVIWDKIDDVIGEEDE